MNAKFRHHLHRLLALATCAVMLPAPAQGQEYPSKPIRIVVGFPPGGIMDIYGRVVGNMLQAKLKNPVVVDNRPGAGGLIGVNELIKSAPDGYTLSHMAPSTVSSVFVKDLPFDPLKVLQPIASVWIGPFVLSINNQVPATTLKEFVDHARANPGKLNFGSTNGPNMMPMTLLASVAGVQIERIDYKGAPQMHTALLTNEIQGTFNTFQSIISYLDTGKIRVLAVTGSQRLPRIPNVATMAELGYPGVNLQTIGAIMAPAGVPAPIAQKLNAVLREIVGSPEMEKLLRDNGRPLSVSPEELTGMLREEHSAWEAAAKATGFKPQ